MGIIRIAAITAVIISLTCNTLGAVLSSESTKKLKPEARDESSSQEEDLVQTGYVLPNQIFNDGKPFYVEKDPISGQLDFSSKKAGYETAANEIFNPNEKIVLSSSTPNFHDFLNLPVKYSSSKFVYPLVSSSYANLKYQGNNKNFIAKKVPTFAPPTKTTITSPHYYDFHKNDTTSKSTTSTTTITTSTTSTTTTTTPTPRTYTTRKPIPSTTPFTNPTTTTTRKKFIPTKKYTHSTPSDTTLSEEPKKPTKSAPKPTPKTTTPMTTEQVESSPTPRPSTVKKTTQSTTPRTTTKTTLLSTTLTTSRKPVVFEDDVYPPSFSQIPSGTKAPNMDASEVYHTVGQKNEAETMSLSDIFNALADEEEVNALQASKFGSQGFDNKGNLMRPIKPSKPAPFSIRKDTFTVPSTTRIPELRPSQESPSILSPKPTQDVKPPSQKQSGSNDNGEYVQYQVQQPNVMKYHPTSNINNVVISPDQNSASFVLGSQQSVGANSFLGSLEKEPLFSKEPPVQYGTVISENINGAYAPTSALPHYSGFQQIDNNKQTQELLVSSNIRFPPNEEQLMESSPLVNGHAQPLVMNLQSHQSANPVVFPKSESINSNSKTNEILSDVQIQKHEVLTLNQHNLQQQKATAPSNKFHFPQQTPQDRPQQLIYQTYPQQIDAPKPNPHMEPPHFHTRQPPSFLHRPPPPPGSSLQVPAGAPPPTTQYTQHEYTRKPIPGMNRPNPDRTLPNILPQFRPNAKLSQHSSGFNQELGNVRIQHPQFQKRPGSPQFAHRRQPVEGRHPVIRSSDYPGVPPPPPEMNRRVYRAPPYQPQFIDRNYLRRPPHLPQLQKPLDYYGYDHPTVYKTIPDSYQARPDAPVIPGNERLAAFEEEDLVVNDPPKPVVKKDIQEEVKLEPVVTLQMLKSQQKSSEESSELKTPGEIPSGYEKAGPDQNLYVVYPIKSADSPTNPDGASEDQMPPLKDPIPNTANDYQNTPFSVVRDQPQEPILVVKNKVHTLQQKQAKDKFPYRLEKPDRTYIGTGTKYVTDIERLDRDPDLLIAPQNGQTALTTNSADTPIAIAYTPTEHPHTYGGAYNNQKFSNINLAAPVIKEIRESHTEDTLSQDIDTRGQNFEKDFMAPFYPSMSLDTVTSSPIASNGWNVYHGSTDRSATLFEKNNINRADVAPYAAEETTTKPFEIDRFQPELQGGFKPIYPPGYKHDDDYSPEREDKLEENGPLVLALTRVEPQVESLTTPSSISTESHEIATQNTTTVTAKDTPHFQSLIGTTTTKSTFVETTPKTSTTTRITSTVSTSTTARATTTSATSSTSTTTTPQTTQRTKSLLETSLEALLFGDDDDFEDEQPTAQNDATKAS